MDWQTVISTVVGVLAGGGINAYYSWQGSQELRQEAERLRRQTALLMRGLEEAAKSGNIEWNRNDQGEIIGISFIRLVVDAENFDLHEASLHSSLR